MNGPLWSCGFRPFYLGALLLGFAALAVWMGFLEGGVTLPATPGGPWVWHAHQMLVGMGMAAVVGFLLTAVPEFTGRAAYTARQTQALFALWLAGRVSFMFAGTLSLGWVAALDLALPLVLLALIGGPVWRDPERRQQGFIGGVLALLLALGAFWWDALQGRYPMRGLLAFLGGLMALMVVAMSRISMRLFNDALAEAYQDRPLNQPQYLARPPRRNLSVLCIALYTVTEFVLSTSPVLGWLALAAAAALFNLLSDWHLGRGLFRRWPFLLYLVYLSMAFGYALLGLAHLGLPLTTTAGHHVLALGGMMLATLLVMTVSGRAHAGYALDGRRWVIGMGALVCLSALLRALAGVAEMPVQGVLRLSGLAILMALGLMLIYLAPLWWRARPDGLAGCADNR